MTIANPFDIIPFAVADVAHLVERHLAKVEVASSSLVIRSRKNPLSIDKGFFQLNPSFVRNNTVFDRWNHFMMKSDFVGITDGFNFICETDFFRVKLGFHRALHDFITLLKSGVVCNGWKQTCRYVHGICNPYPKTYRKYQRTLFFIQSEGLVCNLAIASM